MGTIEHNSGCLTVRLTPIGGITSILAPVCSVDIGIVPDGALLTFDGIPFITSDGEFLIVTGTGDEELLVGNDPLMTANDELILVNT